MAEPDAVFLNILVHHGKQLPDRGRLLRVGQLDADGLRQTAFFRTQSVPQALPGQKNSQCQQTRSQEWAQIIKDPHFLIQALRLFRKRMPHIKEPQA